MTSEYPLEFLNDCRAMLSDEYAAFMRALADAPAPSFRINPKRPQAVEALAGVITGRVAWEENGFYAMSGFKPGSDPVHFAGGYYMQEASAMAPARVLDCKPGWLVLDLCAAPGGKSGQIVADLKGRGALIANEPNEKRARMLAGNLERLGAENACVVCATPDKLALKWPDTFDAIMVDAPCSGEGMFRRDADSRDEWSPKRAEGCAERQREILSCAVKMLKPSGRLVYSTCTFNEREDGYNADWLADNFDMDFEDFSLPGAGESLKGRLKLWPHRVNGEGQFMALFRKRGEAVINMPRALRDTRSEVLKARGLLEDALGVNLETLINFDDLKLSGDALYAARDAFPDMSGVKTFMRGVRLARIKSGYALPDHALAMAMRNGKMREIRVDEETAQRFMRGLEIPGEAPGWALVAYKGMPLGFGKCSQGRTRNHLPKGLRL